MSSYRVDGLPDRRILVVNVAGRLIGLEANTGQIVWRNDLDSSETSIEFAIHGSLVLAISNLKTLYCIDYLSGRTHWSATTSTSSGPATMLCDGPFVFVARQGDVDCFNLQGQLLWTQKFSKLGKGRAGLGMPNNVRYSQ